MNGSCPSCKRSYDISSEFLAMGGKAKCPHCLLDLEFPPEPQDRDPRHDPTRHDDGRDFTKPDHRRDPTKMAAVRKLPVQRPETEEVDGRCPSCQRRFKIAREYLKLGGQARCPHCAVELEISEPIPAAPPPPAEPAAGWQDDTGPTTEPKTRPLARSKGTTGLEVASRAEPTPESDSEREEVGDLEEGPALDLSTAEGEESGPGSADNRQGWGDTLNIQLPELDLLRAQAKEGLGEAQAPSPPPETGEESPEGQVDTDKMNLRDLPALGHEAPFEKEADPSAEHPAAPIEEDEERETVEFDASRSPNFLADGQGLETSGEFAALPPLEKQQEEFDRPEPGELGEMLGEAVPDLSEASAELDRSAAQGAAAVTKAQHPKPSGATESIDEMVKGVLISNWPNGEAASSSEETVESPPASGTPGGVPISLSGDIAGPAGPGKGEALMPGDSSTPLSEVAPEKPSVPFAGLASVDDWATAAARWAKSGFKVEEMPSFIRGDRRTAAATPGSAPEAQRASPGGPPVSEPVLPVPTSLPVASADMVEVSDSDIMMVEEAEFPPQEPKVVVSAQEKVSWAKRDSAELKKTGPAALPKAAKEKQPGLLSKLASPPVLATFLGIMVLLALGALWLFVGGTEDVDSASFPSKGLKSAIVEAPAPGAVQARDEAVKHYGLGNRLAYRGKFEEAVGEYQQALRLDPAFPHPNRALGSVYSALGKGSLAATAYRKYLDLAPDSPDAPKVKEILDKFQQETAPK